jgi:hypothetical protein
MHYIPHSTTHDQLIDERARSDCRLLLRGANLEHVSYITFGALVAYKTTSGVLASPSLIGIEIDFVLLKWKDMSLGAGLFLTHMHKRHRGWILYCSNGGMGL